MRARLIATVSHRILDARSRPYVISCLFLVSTSTSWRNHSDLENCSDRLRINEVILAGDQDEPQFSYHIHYRAVRFNACLHAKVSA